jgi:hypothetical protein
VSDSNEVRENEGRPVPAPDEKAMRDAEVPWPKSMDELAGYIDGLVERPHDYGTCVYAMSMAATAAFHYVSHRLGVTGFQASCADMDILRRTRGLGWGKILDYENLLYPQYLTPKHFPGYEHLLEELRDELAVEARKKLAENRLGPLSGAVFEHWTWLANRGSDADVEPPRPTPTEDR